jgi:outer membrane receptor protein involved in Fe transport
MFISVNMQAQQIKGKVFTQKDKAPVPFASVGLLQMPDSSVVTGVITLSDGEFTFEGVKPGNYFVKVNYIGYKVAGREIAVKGNETVTTDTIYMEENPTTLNEVVVVGEKLKGKESVDRTTYSIPPLVAKASTNGYELLKKIPQVNVDFQNNVTLNGSSNFIIQVDGRQRDKEFLAKLLPSDIESVEVISNPSGKYEGNIDGVINIILKREARYGMNGNVSFSLKPLNKPTYTGNVSLDYSMGKITFYATALYGSQTLHIGSKTLTNLTLLDSITDAKGKGRIKVAFPSVNTGFDYYMNEKNNLSFNIAYKPIRQYIDMDSESELKKHNETQQLLESVTNNDVASDEVTFSLFHKKTFKKPVQEFSTDMSYYIFSSREDNGFENNRFRYIDNASLSHFSRMEKNINDRSYFSTKLNYVQPVGMNTRIEAGYQFYFQDMNVEFSYDNIETKSLYDYKELRNSAYAGITFNLKKIGFQTLVRLENSHINADSVTSPDYTCLLPSANLQYKFSNAHNVKLTYNRRINRPGIYDMNPNDRIGTNYDVSRGNPDLQPEYRDRFQLTYTWNFGNNYFSPNVYYEKLSDKVARQYKTAFSDINNSLTTFSKPYNLLTGYETGAGLTAMLWFVNINARIFKGHFDEYSQFNIPANDYNAYAITTYGFAPLDKEKKTTAFAFLSYNGTRVEAQTKTYQLAFYGFGAQKQIKDHSIGFVWVLPFSSNVDLTRTETETPVFRSTNTISFDVSWFIQVMYSYKFNKGKNVKKIGHKVEVESDSKSQNLGM